MSWGGTDDTTNSPSDTGNPFTDPNPTRQQQQSSQPKQKVGGDGGGGGGGRDHKISSSNLRRDESMALGMTQDELQQHIQHNLSQIHNSIAMGEGYVDMLGGSSDCHSLRSKINPLLGKIYYS